MSNITLKISEDYVKKYIDSLIDERLKNRNDVIREALHYYRKEHLGIDDKNQIENKLGVTQ
jgi:metal-responsive CopG/Arc/MetJ family transcriptional regulator